MLNEQDATRMWHKLFRGQAITSLTLSKAEALVEQLNLESPLRLRFSAELAEIRNKHLDAQA